MESPFESHWGELIGQQIQIRKDGDLIRIGYVEDVTYAGDGLWLETHGNDLRMLFMKADGYSVTVVARVDEGTP